METSIILIYCICDDYLKLTEHIESKDNTVSDAEVLTFMIISAIYFYGNHEKTRLYCLDNHLIANMLSKSQLNRRMHKFDDTIWEGLKFTLRNAVQTYEENNVYIVDSFPVSVCENARINRCRIVQGKKYHGKSSSKQRYFYGFKINMLISENGFPVEVLISPGSVHDMASFKAFALDVPPGSIIHGDKAYTNYKYEDFLKDEGIHMCVDRQKNHKRQLGQSAKFIHRKVRKKIETVFSQITNQFPKKIHAVTERGFIIKIMNFILGYTINLFLKFKCTSS